METAPGGGALEGTGLRFLAFLREGSAASGVHSDAESKTQNGEVFLVPIPGAPGGEGAVLGPSAGRWAPGQAPAGRAVAPAGGRAGAGCSSHCDPLWSCPVGGVFSA